MSPPHTGRPPAWDPVQRGAGVHPGLLRGCRQAGRASEHDMNSEARQGGEDAGARLCGAPPAPAHHERLGTDLCLPCRVEPVKVIQLSVGTRSCISGLTDIVGSRTPCPVPFVAHLSFSHLGGKP